MSDEDSGESVPGGLAGGLTITAIAISLLIQNWDRLADLAKPKGD